MDCLPENKLLQFPPKLLHTLRKQYNLDGPGQMEEAVNILSDWIKKQAHFKKKDFSTHYLEMSIIMSKGSIERAKSRLDGLCTMKTLMPQYFRFNQLNEILDNIKDFATPAFLPKLDDDNCRVCIFKVKTCDYRSSQYMDLYSSIAIACEYLKGHDYMDGFVIVTDYTEADMIPLLGKFNPIHMKNGTQILFQGFGTRVKGIHIIAKSKVTNALVAITKQVTSPKISERVFTYQTRDELCNKIPRKILPKEYGGEEKSLEEMFDDMKQVFVSDDSKKFLESISEAVTDESCRPRKEFNEQYAGMSGTFRYMHLD